MQKLPKPRFNLKAPNAKGETLIFLVFRFRGKKLLYSTGLNIVPKEWDEKIQRPIRKERRNDLWLLYQQIEELAEICLSIYIETGYGDVSTEEFKKRLNKLTGKIELPESKPEKQLSQKRVEFLAFLDTEIAEMKATKMNPDTLRTFRLHVNILKKFAKEEGSFTYEDVDWVFRLKLIDWLAKRDIQLSYGNKTLKVLRMFLERARKKKIHANTDYEGRGWLISKTKAKGQVIFLTLDELQTLADLKLNGTAEKARDLFLIGAGTGQRFSDYSKYEPHHFYISDQNIPILSVVSQKTHTPAKIPLNIFPWLIPILERHQYSSPKVSMQKVNMWIKEICKEAGFTQKVMK
ncbi:MAG: phage integrase SAM-like domain-containing protein, partial [Bacteroidota bacterium]